MRATSIRHVLKLAVFALFLFVPGWGEAACGSCPPPATATQADLDGDGRVGDAEALAAVARWAGGDAALSDAAVVAVVRHWVTGEALGSGAPEALPAFPGAQGFGAGTPGGRGGRVLIVTSLADYHPADPPIPGTLRWAVSQPGPRTVVFEVAGLIALKAPLWIGGTPQQRPRGDNPYSFLTVAGQSAPGGGVALAGYGVSLTHGVHDVVIRHLRVRHPRAFTGDPRTGGQVGDGFALEGASNVILDHVSCAWSTDECVSIEGTARRPNRNVTVQHSLVAEGLLHGGHPTSPGPHSRCLITSEASTGVSIHHNLMMSCNRRHPQLGGTSRIGGEVPPLSDVRYNVVYNFGKNGIQFAGQDEGPHANIVSNLVRFGPDTTAETAMQNLDRAPVGTTVYLEGNCALRRSGVSGPDALDCPADQAELVSGSFFAEAARPFEVPPVVPRFAGGLTDGLVPSLLAGAGALPHDAHDRKFVRDYREYTGQLGGPCRDAADLDCHDAIQVVPPAPGAPRPDADRDGMPDGWERERGLDPDDPADANGDGGGDGYTHLEDYLNERAEALLSGAGAPAPAPRADAPAGIEFALQFDWTEAVGNADTYAAHPAGLPRPRYAMYYANAFVWHADAERQRGFLNNFADQMARNGIEGLLLTPTAPYGPELERRLAEGTVPPLDELVRRPWVSLDEPGMLDALEAQRDAVADLVERGLVERIALRPFQEAGSGFHDDTGLTPARYAELIAWMVDDFYAGLPVEAVIVHWNTIEGLAEAVPALRRELPIYAGVTAAMPSHAGMAVFALSRERPELEGRDFASRAWAEAGLKTWIAEFSVWDDGRVDPVTGWTATGLGDPGVVPHFFEHYRNLRASGLLGGITWLNKDDWTGKDSRIEDVKDGRWDSPHVHPAVRAWWLDEVTPANGYRLDR